MKTLKVFEPTALCSPPDIYGVGVDPILVQLFSDLNYIRDRGVKVRRFNLQDDPQGFTDNPAVLAVMGDEGQFLPIFTVDDEIVCRGAYPAGEKLAEWLGFNYPH